jgi:hypothetical protein
MHFHVNLWNVRSCLSHSIRKPKDVFKTSFLLRGVSWWKRECCEKKILDSRVLVELDVVSDEIRRWWSPSEGECQPLCQCRTPRMVYWTSLRWCGNYVSSLLGITFLGTDPPPQFIGFLHEKWIKWDRCQRQRVPIPRGRQVYLIFFLV